MTDAGSQPSHDHDHRHDDGHGGHDRWGDRVDYEAVAGRYAAGRALHAHQLDRWAEAIRAAVPAGVDVAVDVGAGTGLFLPVLAGVASTVVAVEPAAAMRAELVRSAPPRTAAVAAVADRLPVASGAADLVWMSAVLHHLPDLGAGLAEVARVLRPGGRLLVRGFFADRPRVPWVDALPDTTRLASRFPTVDGVAAALTAAGLTVDLIEDIVERDGATAAEAAAWMAAMADADTILTAYTPAELAAAVADLERRGDEVLPPLELTLLRATRSVP